MGPQPPAAAGSGLNPRAGMRDAASQQRDWLKGLGSCAEALRRGLRRGLESLSHRSLALCREDLIQPSFGEFIRSHKVVGKYSSSWPMLCSWPEQVIPEPKGPTEIQLEGFRD